jgi:MFS family permease
LACNVLGEDERGLANGLMFGGAYAGNAVGGSGVLFLSAVVGFNATFFFVAAAVLSVTVFIALPMREKPTPHADRGGRSRWETVFGEIRDYVKTAGRSFFGSRRSLAGLAFALLPAGAYAMSLPLATNLAVELGLDDNQVAVLTLFCTIISAVCCVLGGWLSDRFDRRKVLALYLLATAIPTLILAVMMHHHQWIMPVDPNMADRPVPPEQLLAVYWGVSLLFSVPQGLMYGTRTALFMDIANPDVAATQFTAYMALMNLVIWYQSTWQGFAIESLGYPLTLTLDAAAGLVCLIPLAMMGEKAGSVDA